jgi:deoxyribodipyrimidine photo-lyase
MLTPKPPLHLVWFKRDLRAEDHEPLAKALQCGPTVGLFLIEEEWLGSDEFAPAHLQFALECLKDLRATLAGKGVPLLIRTGSMVQVLDDLRREHPIHTLYSHQETGLDWSFKRDLAVGSWCRHHSVAWREFKQFGVVRKLKDRKTWPSKRSDIIERPIIRVTGQAPFVSPWPEWTGAIPVPDRALLKPGAQTGGRGAALSLLHSFFEERGEHYSGSISSPNTANHGCSRLSPHLAWGTVSLSELHWAIQKKRSALHSLPRTGKWLRSLEQFESRLWWHCHFIQKLESEPSMEFENVNREFDGMRESEFDEAKFEAWCKGETGFPMIDACMKALHRDGWINFRMRAMLLSFATYQLWLHWKKPAIFLARHFVDFEPGIHYSQVQMQAGVTGINTIRIYSPKKQLLDQDPEGRFIRTHLPELSRVSLSDLAEPHLMPPLLQLESGFQAGVHYPLPIVDAEESYRLAKERIFEWKSRSEVRRAAKKVLQRHSSHT